MSISVNTEGRTACHPMTGPAEHVAAESGQERRFAIKTVDSAAKCSKVDAVPAGVLYGSDYVAPGSFHGSDRVSADTFHS